MYILCFFFNFHKVLMLLVGICFRLVEESVLDEETDKMINELKLYYNLENSKELFGNDGEYVVITDEQATYVKKLFNTYPSFVKVSDLCSDNDEVNLQFEYYIKSYRKQILLVQVISLIMI